MRRRCVHYYFQKLQPGWYSSTGNESQIHQQTEYQTDKRSSLHRQESVQVSHKGARYISGRAHFSVGSQFILVHDGRDQTAFPSGYCIEKDDACQRITFFCVHLFEEISLFDVSLRGHVVHTFTATRNEFGRGSLLNGIRHIAFRNFGIVVKSDEGARIQCRSAERRSRPGHITSGAGLAKDGWKLGNADPARSAPGEEVKPELLSGVPHFRRYCWVGS
mmetsp:Transcript_34725/g.83924  ORF Transcript_34725/g.83924 Transcript_34725/m.83924 type:complete len:219 (+) Transcript_34725:534-1190(+)